MDSPSLVATVMCTGYFTPCRRPTSSTNPTARATAFGGSSVKPKVSARKNRVSVSVDPSICGNSAGSTAISRSRRTSPKSASDPLCIHSQRPWRNGWQLLRCTGVPLEARTCANSSGVRMCAAISRRFSSFQAGWVPLNSAGSVARRTSRCRSRHHSW